MGLLEIVLERIGLSSERLRGHKTPRFRFGKILKNHWFYSVFGHTRVEEDVQEQARNLFCGIMAPSRAGQGCVLGLLERRLGVFWGVLKFSFNALGSLRSVLEGIIRKTLVQFRQSEKKAMTLWAHKLARGMTLHCLLCGASSKGI